MKLSLLLCVLSVLYLLTTVHHVHSVTFHLPSPTSYVHSCTPQGSWAVSGNLTLSEADMEVFSQNLTFKLQDLEICTIDLRSCPAITSSMTSPSTLSPEVCQCLGKFTEDDYSVYIRRSIDPTQAGLTLTAVVPALPKFSPIKSAHDVGKLPGVTSGNVTFKVNDGDAIPLMSTQNITACGNIPLELTVCAPSVQPGTVLKLAEKGQIMSSQQSCVHIIEKFSFQDVDSYPVVFTYDEGAGCPFKEQFVFHVHNDQQACVSTTTTPMTVTTTTTSPSCKETATSLARQPFTLSNGIKVLCDTWTDGGDWVIIQRRTQGDVDFYRGWTEYVAGFGNITGDFWLGLQDIHTICPPSKPCNLRVDLKDPQHNSGYLVSAQYADFSLGGWTDKYRLKVGTYNGTAGESGLAYSNNRPFSTYDRDNDASSLNCGHLVHGGWWYGVCSNCQLNGPWGDRGSSGTGIGVSWYNGQKWLYANYTEMKVRMQS